MEQPLKKIKRKDYRIYCFRKVLLGVKKAHLFRMQKTIRSLKKARKFIEKPQSDNIEEEEPNKKMQDMAKSIPKFERQIERLDNVNKRDIRIVALYMLKKDFEIQFDKEKAFFEKVAPGFADFLEQMDKETGEKSDNKWFYSLILTTKQVKQAYEEVRDVLGKVNKVKERSKNKRKTKKVRAVVRKQMKGLGIEEEDDTNEEMKIEEGIMIDEDNQDDGVMSIGDSLDDMVSIDYGSDAEYNFDDQFQEKEVSKRDSESVKQIQQKVPPLNKVNKAVGHVSKSLTNKPLNESSKTLSNPDKFAQQQKNPPTFKEKVHDSSERNHQGYQKNRDTTRDYNSNRNYGERNNPRGSNFNRDQGQNRYSGGSGQFDSRGRRDNYQDRQNGQNSQSYGSNNSRQFDAGNHQNSYKRNYNNQQEHQDHQEPREQYKPRENTTNFRTGAPNYHPSWQAKLEQRGGDFIAPFQGKKIKL